jgi:hypothetical protein
MVPRNMYTIFHIKVNSDVLTQLAIIVFIIPSHRAVGSQFMGPYKWENGDECYQCNLDAEGPQILPVLKMLADLSTGIGSFGELGTPEPVPVDIECGHGCGR